jgi:hypothetical protein
VFGRDLFYDLKYYLNQVDINDERTESGIFYLQSTLEKSLKCWVKSLVRVPTKLTVIPFGPLDEAKLPIAIVFLFQNGCCFYILYKG